jgi:hypothetical protein
VNTGGEKRVDEMAHDPIGNIVLAANDAEPVPFVTLISSASSHELQGRIPFPQATRGLHQPVWDGIARLFYVPVTEVDGDPTRGEIAIVDPKSKVVIGSWPVNECQPAGLALGPERRLCVGCSKNAIDAGFPPKAMIIDTITGAVLRSVSNVGGTDEVWYNEGDHRYYLAASAMLRGPVLGVIDADTNQWIQNVRTSEGAHSVAVDRYNNYAFVPLTPSDDHPSGGIGVFGSP